jgi:hypothetical protein
MVGSATSAGSDSETAVATTQTALKDLRRANSGHVAGAEHLLEQLGGGR